MHQAAPERSTLANCIMADRFCCGGKYRQSGFDLRVGRQAMVPGQSSDFDGCVGLTDIIELREVVHVDQVVRPREPQIEHGHQTLAAGEKPYLSFELIEAVENFGEALRPMIFE